MIGQAWTESTETTPSSEPRSGMDLTTTGWWRSMASAVEIDGDGRFQLRGKYPTSPTCEFGPPDVKTGGRSTGGTFIN